MKLSASLAALAALAAAVAAAPIYTPSGNVTDSLVDIVTNGRVANMTDYLVFEMPLTQFIKQRDAKEPSYLDWSAGGCKGIPSRPLGFPFKRGCQRHDFAYRNYNAQRRLSHELRKRVDKKFRQDLYHSCKDIPDATLRLMCDGFANFYYLGARMYGRRKQRKSTGTAKLKYE